jgi:uncharacterized protein
VSAAKARLRRLPAVALPGGLAVHVAATPWARLRGLSGLRRLPEDRALLLPRTRSVHTVGMRCAIDLVWVDGAGAVVRVDRAVRPGRHRACRRAAAVLETAAGQGDRFADAGLGAALHA